MSGIADFIVNDEPVEGFGVNVSAENFSSQIHQPTHDYGAIVFRKDFVVGKNQTRTLILYFPNTWHSNTHGRTSATNAELAGQYLIEGKWHDWWVKTISAFAWDAEKELNRKVDMIFSAEMRKSRMEWNRIAHTKDYQKQWKAFRSRIDRLRRQHAKAKSVSEENMPDFWSLVPSTEKSLMSQTEWVKAQKQSFMARKKQANAQRKELWSKIRELSAKANVAEFKRNLVSSLRTKEWNDAISEINNAIRSLEPTTRADVRRSMRLQDKMMMLEDPWSFGVNAENALKVAGRNLVNDMKDALHGAKAPGLSQRTMDNRRYRRNPETPALDETGEFIESLTFDII